MLHAEWLTDAYEMNSSGIEIGYQMTKQFTMLVSTDRIHVFMINSNMIYSKDLIKKYLLPRNV